MSLVIRVEGAGKCRQQSSLGSNPEASGSENEKVGLVGNKPGEPGKSQKI